MLLAWASLQLSAGEVQTRFFEQLRSRQLFGLAERYCFEKLARADLSAAQRIDLSYELSRTFVEHAMSAPTNQQADLWDRSIQVLEAARERVGEHERRVLLDLQTGFVALARGHALRWQSALVPDDAAMRQQALQEFATGTERLASLDGVLKDRIRKPGAKEIPVADKLLPAELRRLILSTEFELGKAAFETANLLPVDHPDRAATIESAKKWLAMSLNADRHGEVGQISQILLAGCARLRFDAPHALRFLDELQDPALPAPLTDLIIAERVRVLLMQQKSADAADVLSAALKGRDNPPGEFLSLRVECLLQMWQAAQQKQASALAADIKKSVDEQLERIRVTHPGYWAAYCQMLVTQATESKLLGADLAQQVRQARGFYSAGQIPQALAAYSAAAQSALDAGNRDLAFDLTYTRGSIEIQARQFATAAKTFDDLVGSSPEHAKTPDADFLAAYAWGQLYASEATRQNREAYTQHLESHRRRYPEHPTFGETTWLLGQLEEQRLQNSAAIRIYQEVPAKHPRASTAAAAMARCYDRLLLRLDQLHQPPATWEKEALERLPQLLPDEQTAKTLSEDQATVALHLANIMLRSEKPNFVAADRWLTWVSTSAQNVTNAQSAPEPGQPPSTPPQWKELDRAAARLRVVSLAGQRRYPAAEEVLAQLASSSPSEMLSIIDGLSTLVAEAQSQTQPRYHLGELQLHAALNLQKHRSQLSVTDQQRLDRCIAEAYVAAGRYEDAATQFRDQLKSSPQNAPLLTGYAHLLLRFKQPDKTQEAQSVWKQIEAQQKAGSAGWFEARYQSARCELLLGKPDQALKLINVTRALYPQLGSPEMQEKFQDLQEVCAPK